MTAIAPTAPTTPLPVVDDKPLFALFLDIDGVLFGGATREQINAKIAELFPYKATTDFDDDVAKSHLFDKRAVKNLDRVRLALSKKYRVMIVIASNWRRTMTTQQLQAMFANHDFAKDISHKTEDYLPKVVSNAICKTCPGCRGAEEIYFMATHPEFKEFAAIDDNDFGLSKLLGDHYFKTDQTALLTDEVADKIIARFAA